MILEFKLSMPKVNSWNGKWSREGEYFAKIITFRGKEKIQRAKEIKDKSYYYDFGDGWCASVEVRQIDYKEASKLRKKSQGFKGYDWMIESIIKFNRIIKKSEWSNE